LKDPRNGKEKKKKKGHARPQELCRKGGGGIAGEAHISRSKRELPKKGDKFRKESPEKKGEPGKEKNRKRPADRIGAYALNSLERGGGGGVFRKGTTRKPQDGVALTKRAMSQKVRN